MDGLKYETIQLPPHSTGGMGLFDAAQKRRTNRHFCPDKYMTLQQLSDCLWLAYGNSLDQNDKNVHGYKVVASACNICPFDVYVFLKQGIFTYEAVKHQLIPYKEGDFRAKSGCNDWCKDANVNIAFMQDKRKNSPYKGMDIPPETRNYYADLDGGHCGQMVYLYAATQGLACCERAWVDEKVIKEVLGLGGDYRHVISSSIGISSQ